MSAGNNQADRRQRRLHARSARFQKHGVDVAFEMIDSYQRFAESQRDDLCHTSSPPEERRPAPGPA